ncbi:MAG TPA: hypothetical protein VNZ46_18385 [Pedobacter sp.]|jgi:hypothetical protein|nr:hypothetical protein [Pedobacter sp.]
MDNWINIETFREISAVLLFIAVAMLIYLSRKAKRKRKSRDQNEDSMWL